MPTYSPFLYVGIYFFAPFLNLGLFILHKTDAFLTAFYAIHNASTI